MSLFKRRKFLLFSGSSLLSLSLNNHSLYNQSKGVRSAVQVVNKKNAMVDSTYQLTIKMSQDTVNALSKSNYSLYCFIPVQCWDKAGVPLVWKKQDYSLNTIVQIVEMYNAYTSRQQFQPGTEINPESSYPIKIGQILEVQQVAGTGEVKQNGTDGAISIYNKTQNPFTCGISMKTDDSFNPICDFPLFGDKTQFIIPVKKIMLLFSTTQVKAGTVIVKAESTSILIDLAESQENQRTVNYEINKEWDWGGEAWAQTFPRSTDLTKVLIADIPPDLNPGILVFR